MKFFRLAFLASLLLAAAALFLLKPASPKRSYVIGVIGNFKGNSAQVGVESFNAIMLAYEEYKKSHPRGFDLAFLPTDNSWDPAKTRPAYLECADQSDLLILLTGSSHVMLVYDDFLDRPETVHALLGPTTTRLTGIDDNVVRNLADLEYEQTLIAAFADSRGFRRILVAVENEYNPGYTEPAAEAFLNHSRIPKIDVARFSGLQMDTAAVKAMLASNQYDALYAMVGGMPREAAILVQQARSVQPGIPVLITPWTRGMIFDQALGPENHSIFMPSHVMLENNPAYDRFAAAYREMFRAETHEYFVPLMYDLASSLFLALDKSPSPAASDLLPVLLAGKYHGIAGAFGYDPFGDAVGQMHFHSLVNGQWRFVSSEPQNEPSPSPAP